MAAGIQGIKSPNRAVKIVRHDDGGMTVEQASGNTFHIPANDADLQAFVVFTMIHSDEVAA